MFQDSELSIKFLMLIVRQTLTNLNMQLKKIAFVFQLILTLFGLTLVSIGYTKSENRIKKLDRIIAVVDQDVITEKELQEKIKYLEEENIENNNLIYQCFNSIEAVDRRIDIVAEKWSNDDV